MWQRYPSRVMTLGFLLLGVGCWALLEELREPSCIVRIGWIKAESDQAREPFHMGGMKVALIMTELWASKVDLSSTWITTSGK